MILRWSMVGRAIQVLSLRIGSQHQLVRQLEPSHKKLDNLLNNYSSPDTEVLN